MTGVSGRMCACYLQKFPFSTEESSVCSLDIPEGVQGIEAVRTARKDGVCSRSQPAT